MEKEEEILEIVIVGGGICGLATALALHRKNIKSVVLERSDTLRATGAAIGIFSNGWRALHQLGLKSTLQSTCIPIHRAVEVWAEKGAVHESILRFLIGCDGVNSGVANYIGLTPLRTGSTCAVRGLTTYPNGHGYAPEFMRVRKDKHLVGRIPIDEKTVNWFMVRKWSQRDAEMPKDPASIKQMILDMKAGFSKDFMDMMENCDLASLSFTRLKYRAPWSLLSGKFRRGNVTVARGCLACYGSFPRPRWVCGLRRCNCSCSMFVK